MMQHKPKGSQYKPPERTWAAKSLDLTHQDVLGLIEWFQSFERPTEAFKLNSVSMVAEPEKFFRQIEVAIAQGPGGPRARYGAIQQDLMNLHRLFKDAKLPVKVEFEIGEEDAEDM